MASQHPIHVFLETFLELDKQTRGDTRPSILLGRVMELFQTLPGGIFASLYLLNEDTFELEHSHTYPAGQKEASKVLYTTLHDQKVIGKALSYGVIREFKGEDETFDLCLVIPIVSTHAAVGLIILPTLGSEEYYDPEGLALISVASALFANIFSAKRLKSKLGKSQELLDQKVASRTIEISESRRDLFDRFETFRTSISTSIPHEVRTPLNHILGFSEYLLSATGDIESEENKEILTDIRNAATKLNHLFEHYILYNHLNVVASNIEELQKLQSQVVHSPKAFLEDLVLIDDSFKDRKQDLTLELNDAPVAISSEHLKKILEEILSNALKYSEPGTPVQVSSQVEGDYFKLRVEDHGRGMTKEQSDHIEAFVQFDRDTYEQQGLGLGMAIVVRIIDIHEGTIKVKSQTDVGTTVTVGLPLAKVS